MSVGARRVGTQGCPGRARWVGSREPSRPLRFRLGPPGFDPNALRAPLARGTRTRFRSSSFVDHSVATRLQAPAIDQEC